MEPEVSLPWRELGFNFLLENWQELTSLPSVSRRKHLQMFWQTVQTSWVPVTDLAVCSPDTVHKQIFSFFVPRCKWKTRDSSQTCHLSIVRYKWDKCTGCGQAKTLWPLLNYFCCPVRGLSKQQNTKTVTSKVMRMILWLKTAVEIQRKIQALKTQFHRNTRNWWIPREVRILQRRLSGLVM